MTKLGKRARKFAKKNLQSVLKKKRKLKVLFKRKSSKRRSSTDTLLEDTKDLQDKRKQEVTDAGNISLDAVFDTFHDKSVSDDVESDECLTDDSDISVPDESERQDSLEDDHGKFSRSSHSGRSHLEFAAEVGEIAHLNDQHSEDDNPNDNGSLATIANKRKHTQQFRSLSSIDSLDKLVVEQCNVATLKRLLNDYNAACMFQKQSSGAHGGTRKMTKIVVFVLFEADNIFQKMMAASCSNIKEDNVSELKNNAECATLRVLIKSYFRATLFLLHEVSDSELLNFILTRLQASIRFFSLFPSLSHKFIKMLVRLWATGDDNLAPHSFLIIREIAGLSNNTYFDSCFIEAYKAMIVRCKYIEPASLSRIQYLKKSFVDLCLLDVLKSSNYAFVSVQQLAKIMKLSLQTRNKEFSQKICSWEYSSSIDIWVQFFSLNTRNSELQPLVYMIIQIIYGVSHLFPGPRYAPLRIKSIQWLIDLSTSTGVFIPVTSLILDIPAPGSGKDVKQEKGPSFSTCLKLPKHWIKTKNFQEACLTHAIEMFVAHFTQWSFHISFPELATFPLIFLKKLIHESVSESSKKQIKRFIDQVEQNVEFVRRQREDVNFSPKDQQAADSFLQLGTCRDGLSFTKYYASVLEKASCRIALTN